MIVVTVARRPIEGATVASNVLLHGCGALNVDGSRVAADGVSNHARGAESSVSKGIYGDSKGQETHQTEGQKLGRWPANLVLEHREGCKCVGEKEVGHGSFMGAGSVKRTMPKFSTTKGWNANPLDVETVTAWDCTPDCLVAALDEQSGNRPSGFANGLARIGEPSDGTTPLRRGSLIPRTDVGGASRFFKQVGGQ